ncbi:OsmC family protein [Microbacterium sp. F1-18]|uniref:OsmC family protein n=1 Tax=unclassified Microbacterium TaxID=2609290 RepID=UPI000E75BF96|nr:OsmC family protein [Microbacterium sp. AG238]RKE63127.1 organic hydroperoxide reductase OsmC/OhrA [Microbacterium sp. AG238]
MVIRYRTSALNDDGGTGVSRVPDGVEVAVSNPLQPGHDTHASNPEQLLALAWSTCLNATAQAIVAGRHRTKVRVEVALRDAEERPGYEFVATAFVSGEGLDESGASQLAAAAHDRCPVSRLLEASPLAEVRGEAWAVT